MHPISSHSIWSQIHVKWAPLKKRRLPCLPCQLGDSVDVWVGLIRNVEIDDNRDGRENACERDQQAREILLCLVLHSKCWGAGNHWNLMLVCVSVCVCLFAFNIIKIFVFKKLKVISKIKSLECATPPPPIPREGRSKIIQEPANTHTPTERERIWFLLQNKWLRILFFVNGSRGL